MINRLSEIFAKARVKASRLSGKILLGSTAGGLPLTSIRSLEEVLYREFIKNHVADIITIYEPNIVKYDFPEYYPPYFRRDKTFEKRCLFLLKDVYISPDSGMVWLPEGYILEESVGSLLRMMGWGGVLHEPLLPSNKIHICNPIVACPPGGYYHWLFEIMPNVLHMLSMMSELKILIPVDSPRHLTDSLDLLLGADECKHRIIRSSLPVRVSNLIMPQVEVYSGFIHPEDIKILRSIFKSKTMKTKSISEEYIYVSRSMTTKRFLSNEAVIEEELQKLNFSIVHCENMNFHDQINLFSNARIIIGPHGAGLSNMIWASLPCEIIEIYPYNFFNDCYARLAKSLGFGYEYVLCPQDQKSSGFIPIQEVVKKAEVRQGVVISK